MVYTTNEPAIVKHAKYCYENYPTIVNNIPKEKNHYDRTNENYALIDNKLAKSQLAIGESSNLAQICLTYSYNFKQDHIYEDYTCILSVLAQAAIDNAKRTFAVDIPREIKRIKKAMDIESHGYPMFWKMIRPEFQTYKVNKDGTETSLINKDLVCPMNYLCKFKRKAIRDNHPTIPVTDMLVDFKPVERKRTCKKVERMIEKYSIELIEAKWWEHRWDSGTMLILLSDMDDLIQDIRQTKISGNYRDLMMILVRAALCDAGNDDSNLKKNKPILLKTLYEVSPKQFLSCFVSKK